MPMDFWKPTPIEPEQCLGAQIGPLGLWLKRTGDELLIAVKRTPEEESEPESIPLCVAAEVEDLDWGRWIVGEETDVVQLIPVMPDRPVVVRPEAPVKIPTGREALFLVSIPAWVRVTAGESAGMTLCEEPPVVLSNIWFGDPMSGELCYSLRTRARRAVDEAEVKTDCATSPVSVRNTSGRQLDVERLWVHVESLRIYGGSRRLWTNEVRIDYRGEDQNSRIEYAQKPPEFAEDPELLSEPRTPVKSRLLKKTLGTFKFFTGI